MGGGRLGQRIEVVAALQRGDDPALGDLRQLGGDPAEILGLEAELGERIGAMGVEGRRMASQARRNSALPEPGARAALTILPATPWSCGEPVPG
jgi:hypothetical protein